MLNTNQFKLLAGNPEQWDRNIYSRLAEGASLTVVQEEQHDLGRRSARLSRTTDNWLVTHDSALSDRAVIRGPYRSKDDAVQAGIEWASQDPLNREFYALKSDVETAQ